MGAAVCIGGLLYQLKELAFGFRLHQPACRYRLVSWRNRFLKGKHIEEMCEYLNIHMFLSSHFLPAPAGSMWYVAFLINIYTSLITDKMPARCLSMLTDVSTEYWSDLFEQHTTEL